MMSIVSLAMFQMTNLVYGAEPFHSGSDGRHGAFVVAAGASTNLLVPPDGVFHFTTVNIGNAANVTFTPNANNSPVYILVSGDFTCSGFIVVSGLNSSGALPGRGGPGGFGGGYGAADGSQAQPGDGRGPGRGVWRRGREGAVFAFPTGGNTNVYGNALLSPLIGGSGGCGGAGSPGLAGGGGGGAILIASSTRIRIIEAPTGLGFDPRDGVYARGGAGYAGGSGGAIRLVAPVVEGNGVLDTRGAGSSNNAIPDSTNGRIRIDCLDDFAYRNIGFVGSFTRGSEMFVFKDVTPRLSIVEAAGTTIPVGAPGPVTVSLPFGSPTNQMVRLQSTGFTAASRVQVTVTPDKGPSLTFEQTIPANTGANPLVTGVDVVIPAGAISQIDAWTR